MSGVFAESTGISIWGIQWWQRYFETISGFLKQRFENSWGLLFLLVLLECFSNQFEIMIYSKSFVGLNFKTKIIIMQ